MRTTAPGQSILLMMDAITLLNREKIDYAVIGAMAGSVHGSIRASIDADAVISLSVQKSAELEEKFQAAGFETELRKGDLEDPIPAVLSLNDSYGNRVDLLLGLRGMENQAFFRALEVNFENETLRVIGKEDFIAMKVFAGGPQDLVDAQRVLAAAESLDMELLRRLVKGFGRDTEKTLDRLVAG